MNLSWITRSDNVIDCTRFNSWPNVFLNHFARLRHSDSCTPPFWLDWYFLDYVGAFFLSIFLVVFIVVTLELIKMLVRAAWVTWTLVSFGTMARAGVTLNSWTDVFPLFWWIFCNDLEIDPDGA